MTSGSTWEPQPQGFAGGLVPGSRLAGYVIEEQIGAGGMAVVYRARDEMLGRLAAVKVIAPALAADAEFRARFLRESRAVAGVQSPYIIPVFGAGEVAGVLYLATRFVAGGDLGSAVRQSGGTLAPAVAATVISQVAAALDAAHAAGLVHRDVKPGNILVDAVPGQGVQTFLSDFGLSKSSLSATSGLSATGQFLGTPDYSPPEQIRGGAVDGRADQYALACVAFVLLGGVPPFHRQDTMAIMFAQVTDPVPSIIGLRPALPTVVDDVLGRALAKSAADRYRTCGEFAAALRDALAGRGHEAGSGGKARPGEDGPPRFTGWGGGPALSMPPGPVPMPSGPASMPGSPASVPPQPVTATTMRRDNRSDADAVRGRTDSRAFAATWPAASAAPQASARVATQTGARADDHGKRRRWRRRNALIVAAAAVVVLAAGGIALARALGGGPGSLVLAGGNYGFAGPWGIASDGTHMWVVNINDSVTEFNASNGNWIRTISGGSYGFDQPQHIISDGPHVWVTNSAGGSVTELNASDGSWIRTLSGGKYGFKDPQGLVSDGTHIWVANGGDGDMNHGSVTELNASDGSWIRTLSSGKYGFNATHGIAFDGAHIWATNGDGKSVTEINASDGSWIRTLSGSSYGFNDPDGIVYDGSHLWVASANSNLVTELDPAGGAVIRVVQGGNGPHDLAVEGTHIWVTDSDGNAVTELNISDGSQVRTVSGGKYRLYDPAGIAVQGNTVWVTNSRDSLVTGLTTG